jgi:ATP-binding cassette subfamily C protein CydC
MSWEREDRRSLARLLGLLAPFRAWVLVGLGASLLTLLGNLTLMATSGWFIAAMAAAGAAGVSMNYFTPSALIRLSAILRTGGRYGERILTHEGTFRLLAHLRVWIYRHLEPLAPAGLERLHSGDLLSRMRADVDALEHLYLRTLVPLGTALVAAGLIGAFLARYDRTIALVVLAFLGLAGLVVPAWTRRLGDAPGRRALALESELRTAAVDGVQGLPEALVYGAAGRQAEHLDALSAELAAVQVRLGQIGGLAQSALGLSAHLALWGVLVLAIPLVRDGVVAPPDLALIALLALAAFESVAPLPGAMLHLGTALAAARRLFAIVDTPPAAVEPAGPSPEPCGFDLEVRGLRFAYPGAISPALDGLDLDLKPGRRVAVVGPSGSGKSTLLALILRFRTPEGGSIRLGGHDLGQYRGEDLRRHVALVSQHTHLFHATLRANLLLAKPEATQAELAAACRISQIEDWIESLPDGYETWVGGTGAGETGMRLSGGEARRIAVARAVLKDAPILLLDEPTEGLDAQSERAMLEALGPLAEGRSLLMVTHRPVWLAAMDEVLVLESGRVAARGTYAELIAGERLPRLLGLKALG